MHFDQIRVVFEKKVQPTLRDGKSYNAEARQKIATQKSFRL